MPLRFKLWKKSQQYNVSDHWNPEPDRRRLTHPLHADQMKPALPHIYSQFSPVNSSDRCSGMSSEQDKKRILLTPKSRQDSDPIYVNAQACSMANSSLLSSCRFDDSSVYKRVSQNASTWSGATSDPVEGEIIDGMSLEERRKLLPPYKAPPDYESYVRRKYSNQGSPV